MWRFPSLALHKAAVIVSISVMGRRAGLPPRIDVWGSHSSCSLSENWCLLKASKSCASNYFLRRPGNRNTLYTDLIGELLRYRNLSALYNGASIKILDSLHSTWFEIERTLSI